MDLFAWCVSLSWLSVGFRTHLNSTQFHSFIPSFIHFISFNSFNSFIHSFIHSFISDHVTLLQSRKQPPNNQSNILRSRFISDIIMRKKISATKDTLPTFLFCK